MDIVRNVIVPIVVVVVILGLFALYYGWKIFATVETVKALQGSNGNFSWRNALILVAVVAFIAIALGVLQRYQQQSASTHQQDEQMHPISH